MTELSTDVATGDPNHADLHNEERAAINALSAISAISRYAIDSSVLIPSASWSPAGVLNDIPGDSGVTISGDGSTLEFAEGLYAVRVRVEFSSSTSGTRDIRLGPWDDISNPFAAIKMPTEPGSSRQVIERTYIVPITTALPITLDCFQNTGSNMAIQGYVWVARLAFGGGSVGGGGGGGATTAEELTFNDNGFEAFSGPDLQTALETIDTLLNNAHNDILLVGGTADAAVPTATAGTVEVVAEPYSGGTMKVVSFPEDQAAFGLQVDGDAYPRIVFMSDPTDAIFYVGDGTFDPMIPGSGLGYRELNGRHVLQLINSDLTFGDTSCRLILPSNKVLSSDGSDNLVLSNPADNSVVATFSPLNTEAIQDIIGAMVSGNTETNIAVTYDDTGGKLNFAATAASTLIDMDKVRDTTTSSWAVTSTSWQQFAGSTKDIVLTGVQVGDWVEVTIGEYFGESNDALNGFVDVFTISSGTTAVNSVSGGSVSDNTHFGILGLACIAGQTGVKGASGAFQLQSGDIVSGSVRLRPVARIGSAGSKTMYANNSGAFQMVAKALRP